MINFCTYFDKNYLSRFLALHASLNAFNFSYTFYVFSLDEFVYDYFKKSNLSNIKVISLKDLEEEYKKLLIAKQTPTEITVVKELNTVLLTKLKDASGLVDTN